MGVEGVCHGRVGERQGVGVLAERGGGVGVAQSGLGLEDLSAGDQVGGDVVAKPVQGGLGDTGGITNLVEPVPQRFGAEATLVAWVGREQPRPYRVAGPRVPGLGEGVPQLGGGGAEGEYAPVAGLWCGQHPGGDGPVDAQHPPVQVLDLEGGELAAAGSGVRGQPDQEQVLFGSVQPSLPAAGRGPARRGVVGQGGVGWGVVGVGLEHTQFRGREQGADLVVA